MKKAAVMIYPKFSLQEITTLTLMLMLKGKQIDLFAAEKKIYVSEDNFQVVPHFTFDEFKLEDYDVLILPGIFGADEALAEERNISFLQQFNVQPDFLIASISASPALLAKAGLLVNKKFCSSLFEEAFEVLPELPKENVVRQPLVQDGLLITAMSFAFKEFAFAVMQALGLEYRPDSFGGIRSTPPYTAEELTFYMPKE